MDKIDPRDSLVKIQIQLPPELLKALDEYATAHGLASRGVASRHALATLLNVSLPIELTTGKRARKYLTRDLAQKASASKRQSRLSLVKERLRAATGRPVNQREASDVIRGIAKCGLCGGPMEQFLDSVNSRLMVCAAGCDSQALIKNDLHTAIGAVSSDPYDSLIVAGSKGI